MPSESFVKIKRQHLVKEQLPSFVVDEHAFFVKFVEAYYEYLSTVQFVPSEKLLDYLDIDSVPQEFLDYFWEEIKDIPGNIVVDKRLLSKHIRDLYASKGTKKSIELLFRILFNEDIQIYEPKSDVIRVSDGKWEDKKIIRAKIPSAFEIKTLEGRKLYQYDQFDVEIFQFIVAGVKIINSDQNYVYVEILPSTMRGKINSEFLLFNIDRTIVLEIVDSVSIDTYQHRGSLYKSGDMFMSGTNPCYVESVGTGKVDGVFIIDGGIGYSIGDMLTVSESMSNDSFKAKVSEISPSGAVLKLEIIDRGFGYEQLPILIGNGTGNFVCYSSSIGRILKASIGEARSENPPINLISRLIMSDTNGFSDGEILFYYQNRISSETGGSFLLEDGSHILSEENVPSVVDTPYPVIGNVHKIEDKNTLTIKNNFAPGFLLDENGNNIVSENGSQIFSENFITFLVGYDSFSNFEYNTPKLDRYTVIGGVSGKVASILYVDPCKINTKLDPIFTVSSRYMTDDGFVSQFNKKMQDSLFYQDFSYVVKSSQSFDLYKNILYKLIHPAGMVAFGEVDINTFVSRINNRIKTAFDDLKIFSDRVITLTKTPIEIALTNKTESHHILGMTYEFLDKYKFMLGGDYNAATYGTSGNIGSKKFTRPAKTNPKNWKISDFSNVKFTDIYTYSDDYFTPSPLILDGSFTLNGERILNGIKEAMYNSSSGKYKLRTDKRCLYTHGVDLTIVPTAPLQDNISLSDSVKFTLNSINRDTIGVSDNVSRNVTFNRSTADILASSDSVIGNYTYAKTASDTVNLLDSQLFNFSKYETGSLTIVDQLTRLDTNAPKDSASLSDVITWVMTSSVNINTNTLNSGTI